MPRQCAHWLAMTSINLACFCGCKDVARNDMQKTGRFQRVQGARGAMTCRRRGGFSGCKDVERNDMQKTGALVRVQGRFPAVFRQCAGVVRTPGKFLLIARSEATWQSASPQKRGRKSSA